MDRHVLSQLLEEYESLIRESPETVAGKIWDCHYKQQSPEEIDSESSKLALYKLLKALYFVVLRDLATSVNDTIMVLVSTGVIEAVMRIAMDDNFYLRGIPDVVKEESKGYIVNLFVTLTMLIKFYVRVVQKPANVTQNILALYPHMFKVLWRYRSLFEDDKEFSDDHPTPGLAAQMVEIISCVMTLCSFQEGCSLGDFPWIANHACHILLICWMNQTHKTVVAECVSLIVPYIVTISNQDRANILKDVIVDNGYNDRLISKLYNELTDSSNLDADLALLCHFIHLAVDSCRPILDSIVRHKDVNLFFAVGVALRRQLCMGADGEQTTIVVLTQGWLCIKTMLVKAEKINGRTARRHPGLMGLEAMIIERGAGFLLFPLASRCTILGIEEKQIMLCGHVDHFIGYFNVFFGYHNQTTPPHPECKKQFPVFNKIWVETMRRLISFRPQHPWKLIIDGYKNLGKDVGFRSSPNIIEEPDYKPGGGESYRYVRYCKWKECLCSDFKPHHKLRVCKGCWTVMYCSRRCQVADWSEGGHRSICGR
ncbi:hypothetical protein C8Q75DRAFT_753465 [Abortiporus biennis]|nr:hypothetical protein C8Q75DRAFT_753465 [Abortiporus biennis]